MSGKRSLGLLVGALAVVLAAAGCGGSSDGGTTSSISKAEFVNQANAICQSGHEKLHTDFLAFSKEKGGNPTPSKAEYDEYIEKVVAPDLGQEIVSEIRALGVPEGDNGSVEAMLTAVEEGVAKAKEEPRLALEDNGVTFAKAIKLATAYGLKVCAETF
jgi:hypothetical protein